MEGRPIVREQGGGELATAALAGALAAIAGGVVWGLIVRWSGYEVGFVAWGIGFLVGMAVVVGARGARGIPFQAVAVVLALVGILIGKYLSFAWTLQDFVSDENIPIDAGIFSGTTWDAFMESRSEVWSLFDLLWVALAVITAFRIPAIETEEEPATAPEGPRDQ